jgi:hypothetical protein
MPERSLGGMQNLEPTGADALFNNQLDPHHIALMFKVRRVFIDEAEKTGNNRF